MVREHKEYQLHNGVITKHGIDWIPLTHCGTKEELLFATKTFGKEGKGWIWKAVDSRWQVCVPKEEYERVHSESQSYVPLEERKTRKF